LSLNRLIQEKIDDAFKDTKYVYRTNNTTATNRSISWIESLLETPIEDHRKYAVWRILAPYLMNIKKLSYDEAFRVIKDWLIRCDKVTPMNFNPNDRIKSSLRAALRVGYFPISFNDLKIENRQLYDLISGAIGDKSKRWKGRPIGAESR
jgi:hypothetical protein